MEENDKLYDDVHNYTKFKLVEMLINRLNDGKTKMDGRPQQWYPRKNWSSMMLFNCSHPSTKNLTLENVNTQTPQYLHRMQWCKDEEVLEVPKCYNYLVGYYHDNDIKVLHYTDGGPWHPGYELSEHSDKWMKFISEDERNRLEKEMELDFTKN